MKISLDCSSQLELVEVVRTEESLGSVHTGSPLFFWSILPNPRAVQSKTNVILQNTEIQSFPLLSSLASTARPESNRAELLELKSLWVVYKKSFEHFLVPFAISENGAIKN